MFRIKALSALVALTVAGAFAASSTPAMAYTSFQVNFKIQNNDASSSMIRQAGSLPTGVAGLADPPREIVAGAADPSTGFATFSLPYPAVGSSAQVSLTYHLYGGSSSACTYTIQVKRTATSLFTLHYATSDSTRCSVPTPDVTNSDGQFTSTTYALNWST